MAPKPSRDDVLAYVDATGCTAVEAAAHFGDRLSPNQVRAWLSRRRKSVQSPPGAPAQPPERNAGPQRGNVPSSRTSAKDLPPDHRERAVRIVTNARVITDKRLPSTTAAVKSWPTVRKSDDKSPRASGSAASQGAPPLSAVVRTAWPSPIARDWKSHSTATKENARPLSEHVPGPLHPDWVEALMGLPIGWSNPDVPTNELHPPAGWPMGQGPDQYVWEPPRMLMKGQLLPWRTERIAALGNGVVPQCVEAALSPPPALSPLASAEPQLDDGAVDSEATAHAE